MSLFQNSSASFAPSPITNLHPPRPALKRSQTPYRPSADSKRRRTSPTGAFSRLSISPPSTRPAEIRQLIHDPHMPSTAINEKNNNEPSNRTINENLGINSNFQFGLFNNNQNRFAPHPSSSSSPQQLINSKETKMRSTYSAYEIDSNRIFIESLSDGEASPTTATIQMEEEQEPNQETRLEISPKITHRFDLHHQTNQATNIFLNSYKFISQDPDASSSSNDQQLILYRKPIWSALSSPTKPHGHFDEPQIVEIDDLNDSDQVDACLPSNPIDSMELD